MKRWSALPRPLLIALATLFAAAMILYGSLWMYVVRHPGAPVELGINSSQYAPAQCWLAVQAIQKDSPAERAGLRPGDHIIAINGRALDTMKPFDDVWFHSRPGDSVELTVARPGQPEKLILRGVFRAAQPQTSESGLARKSALQLTGSYPVLFLVVGLTVLFLRLEDPYAWLLALLFGGFIAVPGPPSFAPLGPELQIFAMAYRAIFLGMFASLFYLFFAVFPSRSPLDRWLPWLKWLALVLGVCVALPGLRVGDARPPAIFVSGVGQSAATKAVLTYIYLLVALGFVSLVGNARRSATPGACRKTRVILWGTVVGVVPIAAEKAAVDFAGFNPPFWLDTLLIIVVLLYPLSFAYAVVKHRVMEIPVLLRRSARYVLVRRGFALLSVLLISSATALSTFLLSLILHLKVNFTIAVGVAVGIALSRASAPVLKRTTQRIDRAFFRSAYDARTILENLAEKTRTVNDRHELASLLESQIGEALHPKKFAGFLENGAGILAAEFGDVPATAQSFSVDIPFLAELARKGRSSDTPSLDSRTAEELAIFAALEPECLVPILGRDGRLTGLLSLGERLSEEPYSRDDKRLLDSAASQTGIALESISMAGKIAERMEAERRAAQEMEIAREVQARLFPQARPPMKHLDYAGGCIQARVVGGDYYDFFVLGADHLGIVIADIAGKGISGALLMSNLQANLRSQYALARESLPRLFDSVNRLFFQNTPDDRYATLFFADYDDEQRRVRYLNCGHNPPIVLRTDGSIERLCATATVLGMFADFPCSVGEAQLLPGDLLVIYTDGITEAPDEKGEEFGEARLIAILRAEQNRPVDELLANIHAEVMRYSCGAQADDLTLVIARAR
ncbi:MAG: SpoIIE family protein phosphatase [Candidatus Acidiferrales bacterium]